MNKNHTLYFLTGFMGAGKSTVGKILSEIINSKFIDLDTLIENRAGKSISDIFADEGEEFFRDRESEALRSLDDSPSVIATGGGIVIRDANRVNMRSRGIVIYLRASWPVTKSRLFDSTDRPLVNPAKCWDSVEARWLERQKFYEDADFIIDTDVLTPEQCAEEIIKVVGL